MANAVAQLSVHAGGLAAGPAAAHDREIHELWFALARRPWSSLVLLPSDAGFSVAEYATALAEVGTRLRENPVTAVVAEELDYPSARRLSDVQGLLEEGANRRLLGAIEAEAEYVTSDRAELEEIVVPARSPRPMSPYGQVIIATRSVVEEPLGVAVAQAADAVVLCLVAGRSRMASARRTLELIGAERVLGAWLIR